jgi:hypothetical protein
LPSGHHIEQDEVGAVLAGSGQGRAAGGGGVHGQAVELQGDPEDVGDARLVLDDQHGGGRGFGAVHEPSTSLEHVQKQVYGKSRNRI